MKAPDQMRPWQVDTVILGRPVRAVVMAADATTARDVVTAHAASDAAGCKLVQVSTSAGVFRRPTQSVPE